ncbi:restriction endonuclease subunit S [Ligilactobacillus ruminis]|uniref:restriction endonuclease subunit S n=1 Tax=Ligilactobacillus ruminis TaxID=1623 RepID=UPI0014745459|nr:restriction endonuclease subunit S [Ligilactobacillus ruminis]
MIAWKQRKLGDVSEILGGGTPSTNHPEYWDGDIDWYSPAEILDQIYVKRSRRRITQLGYDNSSAKLLPPGTVLFTSRAGIGKTAILSQKSCTNQGFQSIVPHENELDTYFIFSRTNVLKRYGELVGAGSTFAEVSGKQMSAMNLMLPTTIQEQQLIGQFFKKLDCLITLHQQKITLLTNLKKAMLEKMFPKKGTVIPKFRFNGFANAWEQQKLGEVFETVTDYVAAGSFADLAENVVYRDTPNYAQLVRTTDLKNGFHSGSNVYVDKKAFDFLYRVNLDKECIILPNIGNCGEVYLVIPDNLPYKHNVLGPNAILIRSDTSDNVFLSILLQGKDFQEKLSLIISPNGQTKFNKTELKQISLNMPKQSDEQHQLGAYFSQLDRLITLHQRKIDKIKNLKKAMLDQMFI